MPEKNYKKGFVFFAAKTLMISQILPIYFNISVNLPPHEQSKENLILL